MEKINLKFFDRAGFFFLFKNLNMFFFTIIERLSNNKIIQVIQLAKKKKELLIL